MILTKSVAPLVRVLAVVLAITALPGLEVAGAQTLEERHARARELFDARQYAEAAEELRAILAADPRDRAANILLAFALARQALLPEALAQTRQALALLPDNLRLQLLLAGLLGRQRETLEEARARYQEVLRRVPDHPLALLGLAEVEFNRGNAYAAIERFGALAEQDPRDARLQVRVAQGWASLGDLARSVEHYQRAYALAPTNVDAVRSLAILYDALDQPREALRYYQETADLYPADVSLQAAIRATREALEEPQLPMPPEQMQKIPLQDYLAALDRHSAQINKRAEQIASMKARSAVRFLPQFFVSPSQSEVQSQLRTRAGRDETTTLGFSFGWNLPDLFVDPYQINLTGLQADLAAVRASLTTETTSIYYARLNEILNYRNLQRALALDPVNQQLRQNKRSVRVGILNLTERLRILTGRP